MGRKRMEPGTTQADKNALRKEFKKPRRGLDELVIYASGNGSLSFVWQAEERTGSETPQRIATGRRVTMDEARHYMRTTSRGNDLVRDGWVLWGGSGAGEPCIIAPVERTGPDTIKMGDRQYTYHIDQTDPFYIRDKEIRQVSLSLTYQTPAEHVEEYGVADTRTVRNIEA
jgi:hypothetical protein